MHNTNLFRVIASVLLAAIWGVASATRYTILFLNTPSVKVGNLALKVGDSFSEDQLASIEWVSDKQLIKVRNEESKRTRVLTKRNVSREERPTLKEYLTKSKGLNTRDFDNSNKKTVQLLDSLRFDISNITKDSANFIAVWHDGDYRVRTLLPLSEDGNDLYITRSIYGHHTPRNANISILKYDLKSDAKADSLGYLQIELLPLVLPWSDNL